MASSGTVEKVPTCFFMLVSISSIFSPERRLYNAFQSALLSWARREHGTRIRKHTNAAWRILRPLSFFTHKVNRVFIAHLDNRKEGAYQQTGFRFLFLRASAALFAAVFSPKPFSIRNPDKLAIHMLHPTQIACMTLP